LVARLSLRVNGASSRLLLSISGTCGKGLGLRLAVEILTYGINCRASIVLLEYLQ
jgi:hypothetical protein